MIPFIAGVGRLAGKGLLSGAIPGGGGGRSGTGGLKASATLEMDRGSLEKFRKQFGETSDQALLRLSLSVSRECAFNTQPKGKKKDKIVEAIEAGARRNIIPLKAPEFKRHAKTNNPAHFVRGRWYSLRQDQILRSEQDIWEFIEKHRKGNKGRVKWVPTGSKAICKAADLNRVIRSRKKLAGDRPRLGKNYMGWAQRHKDKGLGRWRPGGRDRSEAQLVSKVPGTLDKKYFNNRLADEAIKSSWRKTISWYRRQCKIKFEEKGGAA